MGAQAPYRSMSALHQRTPKSIGLPPLGSGWLQRGSRCASPPAPCCALVLLVLIQYVWLVRLVVLLPFKAAGLT